MDDSLVDACGTADSPSPALDDLKKKRGECAYVDLVYALTRVSFDEQNARLHWEHLLAHRDQLNRQLGRDVGVRVAALDYFSNIVRVLENPRLVEPIVLDTLQQEATQDVLTGLPNRRAYKSQLAKEITRARRYNSTFVIALFDVDNFKQVNDAHGHAMGDVVLKQLAASMQRSVRKSDVVARWGGEEFVVLMPETRKMGGVAFAERLRAQVESDLSEEGITISGGVAAFPADGDNEKTLFAFADRALYRAKAEGKNRVCVSAQERRVFPQLDETLPVTFESVVDVELGNGREAFEVDGGVAVRCSQPRQVSSIVKARLEIQGRPIEFIGRVVFAEELAPNQFTLGVEFLEIAREPWELIMSSVS